MTLFDYDDLDMRGLPESVYGRVPIESQRAIREVDDDLRIIWNGKIKAHAVVARAPEVMTRWHGGEYLQGWGIVIGEHRGDLGQLVVQMRGFLRLLDYKDAESAVDDMERQIDEAEAKLQRQTDVDEEAFVDTFYPKNDAEAEAFNRDVAAMDAQMLDPSRSKLILPVTGGRATRVLVDHLGNPMS